MMLQSLKNHLITLEDKKSITLLANIGINISERMKRLNSTFFESSNVTGIAQQLLGKVLCSNMEGVLTSAIITETEAYRAPEDKASHAYGNKRTLRTEVMFGTSGYAYIYLCYGLHHLFNIVTGPRETAHAVLIRAGQPLQGIERMIQRRKLKSIKSNLTAGPALMTKALGITTTFSGLDLTAKSSPIWIEDHGFRIQSGDILASPRVGVDYSEECAAWPWRFRIKNSRWTSPAK